VGIGEKRMTPTPRLRFVERDSYSRNGEHFREPHKVRILQQWWEVGNIKLAIHVTDKDGNTLPSPNRGEWRDVPLEKEA
jgi:hypothetical protein